MTLQHLILLRHGETDWNRVLRMQGHTDVPLNEAGLAQARVAAPVIAALGPDIIVTSDMSRTVATAEMIAEQLGLPVRIDERLRETFGGQWEGLRRDEILARWPKQWIDWRRRGSTVRPPDGESRPEVAARAGAVVAELDSGSWPTGLLVTHGGVIVALTSALLGLPVDDWGFMVGVDNCHWVVLRRVEEEWRLQAYNVGVGIPPEEDGNSSALT